VENMRKSGRLEVNGLDNIIIHGDDINLLGRK
jgi:hypothetical protein